MDPVLCAGEGQNPNHWTTREVPDSDKFEYTRDRGDGALITAGHSFETLQVTYFAFKQA